MRQSDAIQNQRIKQELNSMLSNPELRENDAQDRCVPYTNFLCPCQTKQAHLQKYYQ